MTKFYVLDSGPAVDFFFDRGTVVARATAVRKAGGRIGMCVPGYGEVMAGIECSTSRDASRDVVRRRVRQLLLWPFDRAAAEEYARIYAHLRRIGRPVQHIDMMVAAVARILGDCTIVSTDTDFAAIPGIKVENWSE